jgi:hypothetical protein
MAERTQSRATSALPFWLALLGGHLAWTAHLLLSFPLVPVVCATGWGVLPHVITGLAALVALSAVIVAFRYWERTDGDVRDPHVQPDRPVGWLAFAGFLLNSLFLFAIVIQGVPNFVLNPCA